MNASAPPLFARREPLRGQARVSCLASPFGPSYCDRMIRWHALVVTLAFGCGGTGAVRSEAHDAVREEVCVEIAAACHSVDHGDGLAHECHVNAHGGWSAAECATRREECLAACTGPTDAAGH